LLDLPGHGKSKIAHDEPYTLMRLADGLASEIPEGSHIVGWSLGGMVALELALRYPQRVHKLVLVASSPQFTRSADWPHAVDAEVIGQFAANLVNDYHRTIFRFLAIQSLGSEHAREEIRILRDKLLVNGEPQLRALQEGLTILLRSNLRPSVPRLDLPVQIILGANDTLIPAASGAATQQLIRASRLNIINGAGHAPFISHPQVFNEILESFLHA
jgi:pimeloyl-[acyl-carrier protein] methyl ester esterase